MHRAALLVAITVLAPLAAHADSSVAPPPPPSPPIHRPPPPPRAGSIDDLVGDWSVTTTIRMSSCSYVVPVPGPSSRTVETWSIDHTAGTLTIRTDAAQEYVGKAAPLQHGSFRHQLLGKPRPTENLLQVNHFLKDRFFGTVLRAEPTAKRGVRDVCVTLIDVSGKRAAP